MFLMRQLTKLIITRSYIGLIHLEHGIDWQRVVRLKAIAGWQRRQRLSRRLSTEKRHDNYITHLFRTPRDE